MEITHLMTHTQDSGTILCILLSLQGWAQPSPTSEWARTSPLQQGKDTSAPGAVPVACPPPVPQPGLALPRALHSQPHRAEGSPSLCSATKPTLEHPQPPTCTPVPSCTLAGSWAQKNPNSFTSSPNQSQPALPTLTSAPSARSTCASWALIPSWLEVKPLGNHRGLEPVPVLAHSMAQGRNPRELPSCTGTKHLWTKPPAQTQPPCSDH